MLLRRKWSHSKTAAPASHGVALSKALITLLRQSGAQRRERRHQNRNMRIKAQAAVPKVLMQYHLALRLKRMSNAKGIAHNLTSDRCKPSLHRPNQVNVWSLAQCLMDIHIHRCTCVAQPGEVIDHGLFVSVTISASLKCICGIQLRRHGPVLSAPRLAQKGQNDR